MSILVSSRLMLLLVLALPALAQWQPDQRLTNNPAASYTSGNDAWCVAANGNTVHAVWYDDRDGNYEIYYKRSTDGGASWGADVRLTNNTSYSYYPSVAVSGAVVHVVWEEHRDGNAEIYHKRSSDGGTTWGTDMRLTNNTASSYGPSVAVSGAVVHVVWEDYRDANWEVYYKRSSDGGMTWGADTRSTNNTAYSYGPSVAASGTVVHVVWYDARDGNMEIYHKRSADAGSTWGADKRLTSDGAYSYDPSVAVSGTVVHAVWYDDRDGNYEVYYKRSADAGVTWGGDTRLTNNTASSRRPSVAASGTVVHAVWYDDRDGNCEVYYKRSYDAGASWGGDTRLTSNSALSYCPSVTVSGSAVHTVWYDNRDGNYEIYYKRDPTGSPFPPTVVVTQPSGGEVLTTGSFFDIFWTQGGGVADYDSVYFSIDNGASWVGLVRLGAPTPLTWQWNPIPNTPTTQGKVKVVACNAVARVEGVSAGAFTITGTSSLWPDGWAEVKPVPTAVAVKDGGFLAFNSGNGLIYLAPGNKSSDFLAYEPIGDTYRALAPIPPGEKQPKKGCDGVTDNGNYLYLTKGNNTLEFWRYNISANVWESLPSVPAGGSPRGCKKGTDLCYVAGLDPDHVYLLKGYGPEFYRFNVQDRIWRSLTDAPSGVRPKVDDGSWLCWDDGRTVYFSKAKYNELWPYDLVSPVWGLQLPGMPLYHPQIDKKKKAKDGSAGAWYCGSVYALKGGNTCEFWKYTPPALWVGIDTMPQFGSTGKTKRVKTGGDIVSYGGGAFFALKGNKTNEMWRYVLPAAVCGLPTTADRSGVAAGPALDIRNSSFDIVPNPLGSGFATLALGSCVEPDAYCVVRVYDASGRCVLTRALGHLVTGTLSLDLRRLSAGVYLVRLEADDLVLTRRLVIQ